MKQGSSISRKNGTLLSRCGNVKSGNSTKLICRKETLERIIPIQVSDAKDQLLDRMKSDAFFG